MVYGSRTFDRMLALLEGQGETARLQFPRQIAVTLGDTPRPTLRQPQFRVIERTVRRRQMWYQIFNFRVSYRSGEKEEAFETIVLDDKGHRAPDVEGLLYTLSPLPQPLHAAVPFALQPERAGEIIRQVVERRAVELQQQIRIRLKKVVLRLTGFYRRLMAEIDSDSPEQAAILRTELQQELDDKIAEELERHRLHIDIVPVSNATALLPCANYHLLISGGEPPVASGSDTQQTHLAVSYNGPPPAIKQTGRQKIDWPAYRWQHVTTNDYTIFIGHHWLWGITVLVLDHSGQLCHREQQGWFTV